MAGPELRSGSGKTFGERLPGPQLPLTERGPVGAACRYPVAKETGDTDMRNVFWGVLCALLVFSGIMFTLFALGVVGVRAAVEQQRVETVNKWLADQKAAEEAQHRARVADLRRRQLASNERCVSGTVVRVSGSSYTQVLGGDLRPVACKGRYRLR